MITLDPIATLPQTAHAAEAKTGGQDLASLFAALLAAAVQLDAPVLEQIPTAASETAEVSADEAEVEVEADGEVERPGPDAGAGPEAAHADVELASKTAGADLQVLSPPTGKAEETAFAPAESSAPAETGSVDREPKPQPAPSAAPPTAPPAEPKSPQLPAAFEPAFEERVEASDAAAARDDSAQQPARSSGENPLPKASPRNPEQGVPETATIEREPTPPRREASPSAAPVERPGKPPETAAAPARLERTTPRRQPERTSAPRDSRAGELPKPPESEPVSAPDPAPQPSAERHEPAPKPTYRAAPPERPDEPAVPDRDGRSQTVAMAPQTEAAPVATTPRLAQTPADEEGPAVPSPPKAARPVERPTLSGAPTDAPAFALALAPESPPQTAPSPLVLSAPAAPAPRRSAAPRSLASADQPASSDPQSEPVTVQPVAKEQPPGPIVPLDPAPARLEAPLRKPAVSRPAPELVGAPPTGPEPRPAPVADAAERDGPSKRPPLPPAPPADAAPASPAAPPPGASTHVAAPAAPQARPQTAPEPAPAAAAPEPASMQFEAADLDTRSDRTQFRLVLRDDHLGRVSLNLTERAGLIDLMVRADRPTTVRSLQDSLPALVDHLMQRHLRAETTHYAPSAGLGEQRDAAEERGRRERRQQDHRPRVRARRVAGPFQLAAE